MNYYLRIAQYIENNVYEEEMSAAKDWAQQIKKIHVTMMKQW